MFDWLYAIPLAILILGSGITYFMSSSLFGPFCIIVAIIITIVIRKAYNTAEKTTGWKWLCFFKHKWVYNPQGIKDCIPAFQEAFIDDRFRQCSRCSSLQEGFKIRNHIYWWDA